MNAEISDKNTRETVKKHRLSLACSVLGASALLASGLGVTKSAEASEKVKIVNSEMLVGAMEDQILSENLEDSMMIAEKLKETGFNMVKVSMPWTYPGQGAEIKNDLLRYQNAVRAAKAFDLQFYMTMIPFDKYGDVGQAPVTASQMRGFADTAVSYLYAYHEINKDEPLIIGMPNEPNLETFWKPQKDSAKKVTKLLSVAYPKLKNKAFELGTDVTVVGIELASYHGDLQFIEDMGNEIKTLDIQGKIMDAVGYHPYPETNNVAPEKAFERFIKIKQAVKKNIGDIPVWNTEYGVKTKIPEQMQGHYSNTNRQLNTLVKESEQAKYYSEIINLNYCKNVGTLVLFNAIDDARDPWTSGLFYADPVGTPKSSYERVKQSIADAKSGRVTC